MCTSDILSCIVGVRIPDRSPLPVLESNTHFTSGDSLWQTRLVDTQSFDTTHIYTDPRNTRDGLHTAVVPHLAAVFTLCRVAAALVLDDPRAHRCGRGVA